MHIIIPAGGVGSRLWPLSREAYPKFLLSPDGGMSLLARTVSRLIPVADSVQVVTGRLHLEAVLKELEIIGVTGFPEIDCGSGYEGVFADVNGAKENGASAIPVGVVTEPSARHTMAAIGLAAAIIERRYGDVVVGSFAADHLIEDEETFVEVVRAAIIAAQDGMITTIGIEPTEASSAYGYIVPMQQSQDGDYLRVREFTEKPDHSVAEELLQRGALWNAGMFIARATVLLDSLARTLPGLAEELRTIAAYWDSGERERKLLEIWPKLTPIAIDHAVAEPAARAGQVAVVPANVGWSDIGDFTQWSRYATADKFLRVDSPNAWVTLRNTDQAVAVVGIPDAIVAVTNDAVLLTVKSAAEQVGRVVKELDSDSALR